MYICTFKLGSQGQISRLKEYTLSSQLGTDCRLSFFLINSEEQFIESMYIIINIEIKCIWINRVPKKTTLIVMVEKCSLWHEEERGHYKKYIL